VDESPAREPLDPAIPADLSEPAAFPDAGTDVRVVQTHLSHVFLTADRVYKLHKDADLGFVSFASQRARNLDGLRELELNRRLAPDVYLGIAPIERRDGRWRVGHLEPHPRDLGPGEHCLVMRRLPDGGDALSRLRDGRLTRAQLDRLAGTVARFHREHVLGPPCPYSEGDWLAHVLRPVEANFTSLLERTPGVVPRAEVEALRDLARSAWKQLEPAIARRRLEGRAVDGHGDLHLDHVWLESDDAPPLVIDCVAFDEALRHLDPASDVAFLAMDLADRGHPELAEHLLAAYARACDDHGLYRVIDFFMSYRAAVRAKVAALETADPGIPAAQRRQAEARARHRASFARRVLATRPVGRVTLVGGLIGGGKSTAARALAERTGAVVLASDELRAAVAPRDRERSQDGDSEWQGGRYAPEARARVYEALLERADPVVTSGRDVVLDASWSSRERRAAAREWASARGARCVLMEIRCDRRVALERLEARRRRGGDASEAGPEIYDEFARAFDDTSEWPAADHVVVDTSRDGWREGFPGNLGTGESPALGSLRAPEPGK